MSNVNHDDYIERLNKLQASVDWLVNFHLRSSESPRIPPYKPIDRCAQCGLKLEGVMSYYCPQANCPVGLGSPTFGVAQTSNIPVKGHKWRV